MPLLLYKSLFSIVLLATVLPGIFTMFEVFGRAEARFDAQRVIRLHKMPSFACLDKKQMEDVVAYLNTL